MTDFASALAGVAQYAGVPGLVVVVLGFMFYRAAGTNRDLLQAGLFPKFRREDATPLVNKVVDNRHRTGVLLIAGGFVLSLVGLLGLSISWVTSALAPSRTSEAAPARLSISDQHFHEGRPDLLDFTLKNVGGQVVLVKRAVVEVQGVAPLAAGDGKQAVLHPEEVYTAALPVAGAPYRREVVLRQDVPPNRLTLFQLKVVPEGLPELPPRDVAFVFRVRFQCDDGTELLSDRFLAMSNRRTSYAPPLKPTTDENLNRLAELGGVRCDKLGRLIERREFSPDDPP